MTITKIRDIRGDNVNWIALGKRFKNFREAMCLSVSEVAQTLKVADSVVDYLEKGDRKSTNIIWHLSIQWDLSLNWLLNGLGKPHDPDPLELMPETLIVQKGVGIRRSFTRAQAEGGEFTDHILEFVMAIDKFRSKNHVPFPSSTQLYEVITALGYRKSVPARIAPLGYIVEHQQWAEKLKHINEKVEASLDWHDKEFEAKRAKNIAEIRQLQSRHKKQPKTQTETRRQAEGARITAELAEERARYKAPGGKQRRQRIEQQKNEQQKTRIKGKKFILTDSEGREYAVENLPKFCKEHRITPRRICDVASGHRKQHKGWRARVVPRSGSTSITVQEKSAVTENTVLERIKLGLP